jgi:Mor family transcriptional regulator
VFGGRTVYLPQPTRLRIVRRNQAIQRDRAEGVAIDDLTAIYGLSARKVRHIVGESS